MAGRVVQHEALADGERAALRFHDTRHTTASLLMMFGANPAAVQKILRHTDVRLTVDVYGHLAPDYLRGEIDRLTFLPAPTPETTPAEATAASSDAQHSAGFCFLFASGVVRPPF